MYNTHATLPKITYLEKKSRLNSIGYMFQLLCFLPSTKTLPRIPERNLTKCVKNFTFWSTLYNQ